MSSARSKVLELLEKNQSGSTLQQLTAGLVQAKVLGFGVEARDVVAALDREGKVAYDPQSELVRLQR